MKRAASLRIRADFTARGYPQRSSPWQRAKCSRARNRILFSTRCSARSARARRPRRRDLYALFLALLSALLFGASTPASKALLASLEPFQLAGLLYLGAAAAMAPVVLLERRGGVRGALDRTNATRLGGAVLFGGVLGPVLLLAALRLTLAGSVSLLLNLEMVATAVLGVVFFREHLGRVGWIGVAGVVIAGALVAGNGGWPGLAGALLTAAACVCWAIDNHLTALIDGITPAQSTLVKGTVAGAANLGVGIVVAPLVATPRRSPEPSSSAPSRTARASRSTSRRPTSSAPRAPRRVSRALRSSAPRSRSRSSESPSGWRTSRPRRCSCLPLRRCSSASMHTRTCTIRSTTFTATGTTTDTIFTRTGRPAGSSSQPRAPPRISRARAPALAGRPSPSRALRLTGLAYGSLDQRWTKSGPVAGTWAGEVVS